MTVFPDAPTFFERFESSTESIPRWFLRSLLPRILIITLIWYTIYSSFYNLYRCDHHTTFKDAFADTFCLFTGSYILQDMDLDAVDTYDRCEVTSAFTEALKHHGGGRKMKRLGYYTHAFAVFIVLYLITLLSRILYFWCLDYQRRQLTCHHDKCFNLNSPMHRFICASYQIKQLSTGRQSRALIITFLYHFADLNPLVAVLVSFRFLNSVFDDLFYAFGWRFLQYYIFRINIREPMRQLFPTISKCTVDYVAQTGDLLPFGNTCLLYSNYFNQIAFLFFWFFYFGLFVVFLARVSIKLAYLAVPSIRQQRVKATFGHRLVNRPITWRQFVMLSLIKQFGDNVVACSIAGIIREPRFARWLELKSLFEWKKVPFPYSKYTVKEIIQLTAPHNIRVYEDDEV